MSEDLKCDNCQIGAEYLVLMTATGRLEPYCESHFEELCNIEGESMMTYWTMGSDFEWPDFIKQINERLKHQEERYSELLKKFTQRPQAEKMRELGGRLHKLADEVWNA